MTAQQHAIAGWYKDPSGAAHTLRWWNGTAWTIVTATRKALFTPAHQGVPTITPQRGAGSLPTEPHRGQPGAAIPPPPGGWQHGPGGVAGSTRIYGSHDRYHQPAPAGAYGAGPTPGGYRGSHSHQVPPTRSASGQQPPPGYQPPPGRREHPRWEESGGQREAFLAGGSSHPLAPPSWDPTTAQRYAGAEQFHTAPVAAVATQPPPRSGSDGQPWWQVRETRWTASGENPALKELRRQHVAADPVGQRHNLNAAAVTDLWQPRWLDDDASDHRGGRQQSVRDAWPNMPSLKPDWFWAFAVAIYALVGVVTAGFLGHGPLGQTLSPLVDAWR